MEDKRKMTLSRVYGAPRELVFKAWTDPKLLAKWWGPRLFSNPVCEVDLRVGGSIRIDMKFPGDGPTYPMMGEFREIIPNEKLIFTSDAFRDEDGEPKLINLNTITFEDYNGMTKVTVHVEVIKMLPGTEMAIEGMEQGWSESLYKLGDVLDTVQ